MDDPRHEPGIEHEPHLEPRSWKRDPTEREAESNLNRERLRESDLDRVEHTVWDEPALAGATRRTGVESELTYASWLEQNMQRTTWLDSWSVTLLIALAAGPWGILGALLGGMWSSGTTVFALLALVVFGPVTEEITKVAAALWIVEKRPFCFRAGGQIILCAACGGLAFAAIENLIYMYVYVPQHSTAFVVFRWTVCVALHVGCSTLAGVGLERIWHDATSNLHRPNLALGTRWITLAMVCHGLYNLTATLAETSGWLDLGLTDAS